MAAAPLAAPRKGRSSQLAAAAAAGRRSCLARQTRCGLGHAPLQSLCPGFVPDRPLPPAARRQGLEAMGANREWGTSINPKCTNTDKRELRDGRVSFPSGAQPRALSDAAARRARQPVLLPQARSPSGFRQFTARAPRAS